VAALSALPFPSFKAPDHVQTRLQQIDADLKALAGEMDEGGMTAGEFQLKLMALHDERTNLPEELFREELSKDVQKKIWLDNIVPSFLDRYPQYRENKVLFSSLDMQVREIQVENPDNIYDPNFLQQAHERLAALFRFDTGLPQNEPKQTVAPTDQKTVAAKPPRDMPPNLGGVPASDMTEVADGGLMSWPTRMLKLMRQNWQSCLPHNVKPTCRWVKEDFVFSLTVKKGEVITIGKTVAIKIGKKSGRRVR